MVCERERESVCVWCGAFLCVCQSIGVYISVYGACMFQCWFGSVKSLCV